MQRQFQVLIVDGNADMVLSLQDILKREGYDTATAHDGQAALSLCHEKAFDLLLVDMRLPDIPGLELARRMAGVSPLTEYIVITSYATLDSAMEAVRQKSVLAYELKPLDMARLLPFIRQVVQRRQEEKQWRESEAKYSALVEQARDGVFIVQGDICQFANRAVADICGYAVDEMVGFPFMERLSPESRQVAVQRHEAHQAGKKAPPIYQTKIRRQDGGTRDVELSVAVIQYQGKPAAMGIMRDLTERRRAEETERKVLEYQELSRLKTGFLSMVSHELRTPLASIKGYATMLRSYDRRLRPEERREHLEAIEEAADRLTDLVDHLLDMSRLDAGLLVLERQPADISRLIDEAVAEARLRAPTHELAIDIPQGLPWVDVDTARIRQVLDNLLDNAVKFSERGTRVIVRAEAKGEEVVVSVADQGRGVPAQELPLVFDAMCRVRQRLGLDPGGLGLGLAICKGLVEAHGGRLWAESEVGKGSTFYFTVPIQGTGAQPQTPKV